MIAPVVKAETSAWDAEELRALERVASTFEVAWLREHWEMIGGRKRSHKSIEIQKAKQGFSGMPDDTWELL